MKLYKGTGETQNFLPTKIFLLTSWNSFKEPCPKKGNQTQEILKKKLLLTICIGTVTALKIHTLYREIVPVQNRWETNEVYIQISVPA